MVTLAARARVSLVDLLVVLLLMVLVVVLLLVLLLEVVLLMRHRPGVCGATGEGIRGRLDGRMRPPRGR